MSRHPNLEVFDLNMRRVAALTTSSENKETEKFNAISEMSFRVPKNDTKIEFLKKRRFVRYDNGDFYRIMTVKDMKNATGYKQAKCEHVLATLADDVMFQDHIAGNTGQDTAYAINYILSFQEIRRWVLKRCDFSYVYEYGWSSENLLNALFSVVKPFTDLYKFETNTHVYPFELSLIRLDRRAAPQFFVFERLNFLEEQRKEESGEVFTRIYALGAGEGVNQVTFAEVNNGLPYVDAPQSAIDENGLISGIYTAREYDSPAMLKAVTEALILEVCEPRVEYNVKAVDLHEINKRDLLDAVTGNIIQLSDGYRTFITEITRDHDSPGDMSLKVANKAKDIATQIASLADRQRIESTYSQGATQLWSNTTIDNASETNGHEHPLWIPTDARIINKVMAKIKLTRFRAYSKTTSEGGRSVQTSSSSGGGSGTSSAGGGDIVTSDPSSITTTQTALRFIDAYTGKSGPSEQNSTGVTNSHSHRYYAFISHAHYYSFDATHSHGMSHVHSVRIEPHTHGVSSRSHEHSITIPPHSHQIEYGIFNSSESPSSAMVYVGGNYAFSIGTSYEGDITQYFVGADGKIPRGRFIDIKVVPNTLARVTVSSAIQAFIQSKTGGNY